MEYDFSSLCVDQLKIVKKKLELANKRFIKEYEFALNVINNQVQSEHRGEIMTDAESHLREVVDKCDIFYTETLKKVQRELAKFL